MTGAICLTLIFFAFLTRCLNLGTVNPNQQWQKFPLPSENSTGLKVAFQVPGGDFSKVQSFAWFRRVWRGSNPVQVDSSIQLYPFPRSPDR